MRGSLGSPSGELHPLVRALERHPWRTGYVVNKPGKYPLAVIAAIGISSIELKSRLVRVVIPHETGSQLKTNRTEPKPSFVWLKYPHERQSQLRTPHKTRIQLKSRVLEPKTGFVRISLPHKGQSQHRTPHGRPWDGGKWVKTERNWPPRADNTSTSAKWRETVGSRPCPLSDRRYHYKRCNRRRPRYYARWNPWRHPFDRLPVKITLFPANNEEPSLDT